MFLLNNQEKFLKHKKNLCFRILLFYLNDQINLFNHFVSKCYDFQFKNMYFQLRP